MAKFRFPGKALKLNTRKRVRFRGSYPVSTPEELYTRKIRRGLALFGQLFGGDSDEDEEEFEGFTDTTPRHGKASVPTIKAAEKESKVEQVCSTLEKEGLVRRTRMSAVTMAVKEVKEGKEKALLTLDERTKVKRENTKVHSASDVGGGPECSTTLPSIVPDCRKKVTVVGNNKHKQTSCRIKRQPTVKTALAKKLLAKAKKKLPSLPVVGEKSPKRFILPAMSARSSRIIKPNKRLFADIMEMCSTSSSLEFQVNVDAADSKNSISSMSNKRIVKLNRRNRSSHSRLLALPRSRDEEEEEDDTALGSAGVGRDRMKKTISLYTESITGTSRGQVGRPPKRLLRRLEGSQHEVEADIATSPQKCDAKESRVKEKIEKLLRSPWDDRLKQSGKVGKCDLEELMPAPVSTTSPALSASAISRNILRKARLNLNKSTLLKIRNPASLQRLIPQSDEGKVEGRCIICDRDEGENTRKFGVVICEICCSFIRSASDGPKDVYDCVDASGGCRVQGFIEKDRCLACWLGRILQSCTMPNLLHDRLRKRLPSVLKEKIPTSLARCMNLGSSCTTGDKDAELASHTKRLPLDPGGPGGGAFGNVMDLPGGWRRKTGSEVIVISPSGEKFKSMHKLEEFLKNQGICADARVLFGNNSPVVEPANAEAKSRSSALAKGNEHGRVVVTTLPGGWTRRIKWRPTGGRFDTYVYSPDGRTFRSKRELSAYFQQIGKVDDIHKYFPVVNGNSDSSTPSSSDTTGSSSTEPVSSSEIGSDVSSDDKSPEVSEVEIETSTSAGKKLQARAPRKGIDSIIPVTKENLSVTTLDSVIGSPKSEAVDQADNETSSAKPSRRSSRIKTRGGKRHRKTQSVGKGLESTGCSEETLNPLQLKETTVNDVHQKEMFETPKMERKQRKSKILRTRSLSIGSRQKGDTSFTDTTESESEQRRSIESTLFSRNFSRSQVDISDKTEEVISTEKNELCSAWNLDLYESAGESLFKSDDNSASDERKLSPKSLKKQKKLPEDLSLLSTATIVPDVRSSSEKSTLKMKRKVLSSEESSKDNILLVKGDSSPLNKEALGGIPSRGITGESSLSHLFSETQSPDSSPKKPSADGEESLTISLSQSTPTFDQVTGTENITLSVREPKPVLTGKLASKKKPKLKRKFSRFQSFHFGNNWSRKVKWNEKGEGKVALLHSPDGQTFRSRIELQAYFKKAGKPKVDLDYYFPPVLKREESPTQEPDLLDDDDDDDDTPVQTIITEESEHSSEASDFAESEPGLKTSEDSCASTEGFNRRNRSVFSKLLEPIPDSRNDISRLEGVPKRIVSKSSFGKKVILVSSKAIKMSVNNSESEEAEVGVNEVGGPRVKHVCRSKAQVLGIPRAVFPSPEKEGKMIKQRRREVVTVTEKAASGKILRKTVWCNKCSGCNTPNCQKCANCLDMKKYGGKGTKKKPCIKRKCLNPRLSAKSAAQSATTVEGKKKVSQALPNIEPFEIREISRSPTVPKETAIAKPDVIEDEPPLEIKISLQDKSSVFVPRQMTRIQPDQKDRGDIAAGKKFVPGALVNIDYWQGYDVDEMLLSGFAVTTASPLYPQTLCFRCGSAGKERLLYCICCCEGVHPFCMEDGEGPESDTEELFWICRRCAVCHVCGAPGADSLLRCSDCRNYYHMECLGPSAHSTCQPSPDRPWEADMWVHLRESWPRQTVLYDASHSQDERVTDDVVVHLQLDPLKEADEESCDGDIEEPDIFFLHASDLENISAKEKSEYEEGVDLQEFDLDDTICLEERLIEVFRDVDLHKPQPSATSNIYGEELLTLNDDEYLCLGYKKLREYASRKMEISYYRLLQIIHNELFDSLGYPRWRDLLKEGLVKERPSGRSLDSETDTASEGESDSDDSVWDWEDVLEIRRFEAAQEMKEREDRKLEEERRELEREREMNRLARLKELEKEGKEPKPKNGLIIRKKKKRGRPPGSVSKTREGLLDFIVPDDYVEDCSDDETVSPKRAKFKQPKSWEEFDKLFAWNAGNTEKLNITDDEEEEKEIEKKESVSKTKKARVVYSAKVNLNKKCQLKHKSKETRENKSSHGSKKLKCIRKFKKEKFKKQQKHLLKKKKLLKSQEKISSRKEIGNEHTSKIRKKKAGKSPCSKLSTKSVVVKLDRITKNAKPLSDDDLIDVHMNLEINGSEKLGGKSKNKIEKGNSKENVSNAVKWVEEKIKTINRESSVKKKKKTFSDGTVERKDVAYLKQGLVSKESGKETNFSNQAVPLKKSGSSSCNSGLSLVKEDTQCENAYFKRFSDKRHLELSESSNKQTNSSTDIDSSEAETVGKSEEESSDKENRFRVISEKGPASSLVNGLVECNAGASGSGNDIEDSSLEQERTYEAVSDGKKRTLNTMQNEDDLGDSNPKKKLCKLEETSQAQSPVASKSFHSVGLTLGRRRRSEGRASLLASQRKAMMDY